MNHPNQPDQATASGRAPASSCCSSGPALAGNSAGAHACGAKMEPRPTGRPSASGDAMEACIRACEDCLVACEHCSVAHQDETGLSARLCRDCADVSALCVRLMARDSRFHPKACALNAEICRSCAEECGKHDNDHCRACAEACLRCAEACERMAGSAATAALPARR